MNTDSYCVNDLVFFLFICMLQDQQIIIFSTDPASSNKNLEVKRLGN